MMYLEPCSICWNLDKTVNTVGRVFKYHCFSPSLPNTPYEAYYGLTLNECLDKDRELKSKGYVAIQFRVFNNANEVVDETVPGYNVQFRYFVWLSGNIKYV